MPLKAGLPYAAGCHGDSCLVNTSCKPGHTGWLSAFQLFVELKFNLGIVVYALPVFMKCSKSVAKEGCLNAAGPV